MFETSLLRDVLQPAFNNFVSKKICCLEIKLAISTAIENGKKISGASSGTINLGSAYINLKRKQKDFDIY